MPPGKAWSGFFDMCLLSCCHICVLDTFCAFGELDWAAPSAESPKFTIFATAQVPRCRPAQASPAWANVWFSTLTLHGRSQQSCSHRRGLGRGSWTHRGDVRVGWRCGFYRRLCGGSVALLPRETAVTQSSDSLGAVDNPPGTAQPWADEGTAFVLLSILYNVPALTWAFFSVRRCWAGGSGLSLLLATAFFPTLKITVFFCHWTL